MAWLPQARLPQAAATRITHTCTWSRNRSSPRLWNASSPSCVPPMASKSWHAMATGLPEILAHRPASDEGLVSFLSRMALLVALIVVIVLPVAYWSVEFEGLSTLLEFKAEVKAHALTGAVTANPDLWMYEEHRLTELLGRYPVPLDSELAQVFDLKNNLVGSVGETPKYLAMIRS